MKTVCIHFYSKKESQILESGFLYITGLTLMLNIARTCPEFAWHHWF